MDEFSLKKKGKIRRITIRKSKRKVTLFNFPVQFSERYFLSRHAKDVLSSEEISQASLQSNSP